MVINKVDNQHIYMFDPTSGHIQVPRSYFERVWKGYLLLVHMQPIKASL
ncbi:MAG: cysteine peptidase family C39 domain-containing protein [Gammaproteobacteria bacterium]